MSAIDELRAMLDKRGVEWRKWDYFGIDIGTIFSASGIEWIVLWDPKANNLSIANYKINHTAEEIIAATLGAGTCHYIPDDTGFTWWDENDVEHCEEYSASDECCSASCDKCGHAMMVGEEGWFDGWDEITEWWEEDGSYHKGYVLTPRFKFCPNCGAKVVDE